MSTRTLSVSLPSDALYVSGTVNDVAVTWTHTEGNTWEAVAARADDDVYRVSLTIINSMGTATTASMTLYYGLHLITDRTSADVSRTEYLDGKWVGGAWRGTTDELSEWMSDLRGAYNASDLNRVGAAVNYVAGRLESCGYRADVSPKTDWSMEDIPLPGQAERYLSDIATLRGQFQLLHTTPPVPDSMGGMTHIEANNIEKILEDVDRLLTNSTLAQCYCGELYAGEV